MGEGARLLGGRVLVASPRLGMMSGCLDQSRRIGEPHEPGEDDDQDDAADPLAGHELPASYLD